MMLENENFPLIGVGKLTILVFKTPYRRRILIDPGYFIYELPEEERKLEISKQLDSFHGKTRQ